MKVDVYSLLPDHVKDYIDLLKRQYLEFYNIDLQDYEITEIEEIKND